MRFIALGAILAKTSVEPWQSLLCGAADILGKSIWPSWSCCVRAKCDLLGLPPQPLCRIGSFPSCWKHLLRLHGKSRWTPVVVTVLSAVVWKLHFCLISSIIWLGYTKDGWFQFSSPEPTFLRSAINLHGKWRSPFAKTKPHCIVGVICLEVSAEIKNLSVSKQYLLLPLLIVCDPSEPRVLSRNPRLRLRYDLLISFSVKILLR